MTKRFLDFIQFVKNAETVYAKGHYGDDAFVRVEKVKNDSGGTTKWGLDAATHGEEVSKLSWPQAEQIYWDWYWSGITPSCKWNACDTYPPALGEIVFDTRINSGMGIAKQFLRQTQNPSAFLELRDARNRSIVRMHPEKKVFLRGWLNRTQELRDRFAL